MNSTQESKLALSVFTVLILDLLGVLVHIDLKCLGMLCTIVANGFSGWELILVVRAWPSTSITQLFALLQGG